MQWIVATIGVSPFHEEVFCVPTSPFASFEEFFSKDFTMGIEVLIMMVEHELINCVGAVIVLIKVKDVVKFSFYY